MLITQPPWPHPLMRIVNLSPIGSTCGHQVIVHAERHMRNADHPQSIRSVWLEKVIRQHINDMPSTSTRSIERRMGVSHLTAWDMLWVNRRHHYHWQKACIGGTVAGGGFTLNHRRCVWRAADERGAEMCPKHRRIMSDPRQCTPPPRWSHYSPPTQAIRARFPANSHPGPSHVGIAPHDAAGRQIFSGISRFLRTCIPALLHTHLVSPSSALKTSMLRGAQISPLSTPHLTVKRGEYGAAPICKGGKKRDIPQKTRGPAASSGRNHTCENLGATPSGIEPGSHSGTLLQGGSRSTLTRPDPVYTIVYITRVCRLSTSTGESRLPAFPTRVRSSPPLTYTTSHHSTQLCRMNVPSPRPITLQGLATSSAPFPYTPSIASDPTYTSLHLSPNCYKLFVLDLTCPHSSGVGWPTCSRRVAGSRPGTSDVADAQPDCRTGNSSTDRQPSTAGIRGQFPVGSYLDDFMWETWRMFPLAVGFLGHSTIASGRCCISTPLLSNRRWQSQLPRAAQKFHF
ncbi:hypothetical protein PR048_003317 [Dryococelus australis]|uniref:Uncharacterized protein n=1 Tax=Dryococelus australis TaxID=614101 RepID=A0ABQ9IMR9_9NEOP|nr:hypothetical protein PR048_003317 [Dryococelus australis]